MFDDRKQAIKPGDMYESNDGQKYLILAINEDAGDKTKSIIEMQYGDGTFMEASRKTVENDALRGITPGNDIPPECDESDHIFHFSLLTLGSICAKCGYSVDTLTNFFGQTDLYDKCTRPEHLKDEVRKEKREHAEN